MELSWRSSACSRYWCSAEHAGLTREVSGKEIPYRITAFDAAYNTGIVFSYVDALNFWARVYSKATQTAKVYEVIAGTWTQRDSTAFSITAGVAFTMTSQVRAGGTDGYPNATIPSGQVGLWVSDASDNSFDDFKVQDDVGPFEVDGRWFCNMGDVQVDSSNSNVLAIGTATQTQAQVVRRGARVGKYVMTCRMKWASGTRAGPLVRWVGPGDWLAVQVYSSDGKARLSQRMGDGNIVHLATSGTALSLTNGNWYTMKVVVGDDLGNSALQRLRFWVDTDDDADFSDETTLLDTTTIDDDWSAGYTGVFRGSVTNSQDFDDFSVGLDNSSPKDEDILDAGDDVLVADDFNASTVTPAYNNNGQITFDGVWTYTYDAWRRPRKAQLVASGDTTTIQELAWLGDGRLASRTVTNSGVENTPNDGGNTVVHPYFTSSLSLSVSSSLIEERNGSNQVVRAYLWDLGGAGFQPASPVWLEVNGDPTIGNDTNPDVVATGEGAESPADGRYFYHTDASGAVVALTEYAAGAGSVNGRIVERHTRNPHGEVLALSGDSGAGELANAMLRSSVGHVIEQGASFPSGAPTWPQPRGLGCGSHERRVRPISGERLISGALIIQDTPVDPRPVPFTPPTQVVQTCGGMTITWRRCSDRAGGKVQCSRNGPQPVIMNWPACEDGAISDELECGICECAVAHERIHVQDIASAGCTTCPPEAVGLCLNFLSDDRARMECNAYRLGRQCYIEKLALALKKGNVCCIELLLDRIEINDIQEGLHCEAAESTGTRL